MFIVCWSRSRFDVDGILNVSQEYAKNVVWRVYYGRYAVRPII